MTYSIPIYKGLINSQELIIESSKDDEDIEFKDVTQIMKAAASGLNFLKTRSTDGKSPLHMTCLNGNIETSRKLLELCPRLVRCKDVRGYLPLHTACKKERPKLLELLIEEYSSPIKEKNSERQTPISIAAQYDHLENLKVLIKNGADLEEKCGEERLTPLCVCEWSFVDCQRID